MTINQQYSVAYTAKGDALYHLGDFEYALLNYHRANKYAQKRVRVSFSLHEKIYIYIYIYKMDMLPLTTAHIIL